MSEYRAARPEKANGEGSHEAPGRRRSRLKRCTPKNREPSVGSPSRPEGVTPEGALSKVRLGNKSFCRGSREGRPCPKTNIKRVHAKQKPKRLQPQLPSQERHGGRVPGGPSDGSSHGNCDRHRSQEVSEGEGKPGLDLPKTGLPSRGLGKAKRTPQAQGPV